MSLEDLRKYQQPFKSFTDDENLIMDSIWDTSGHEVGRAALGLTWDEYGKVLDIMGEKMLAEDPRLNRYPDGCIGYAPLNVREPSKGRVEIPPYPQPIDFNDLY